MARKTSISTICENIYRVSVSSMRRESWKFLPLNWLSMIHPVRKLYDESYNTNHIPQITLTLLD
jgi:hypothetical protein